MAVKQIIIAGAAVGAVALIFPMLANADTGNGSILDSQVGDIVAQITGGKLNASQIAGYAAQAGFSGNDLTTAVAVALAESGGNASAYNPETAAGTPEGQGSYGLWQIYRKAHPEFLDWNLNDPQTNANAAFIVYQNAGMNFRPWSTFQNGAYQSFFEQAQIAVNA